MQEKAISSRQEDTKVESEKDRIRERACEWVRHEGSFPLAMAKSAVRHQKEMEEKKDQDNPH